MSPLFTIDSYFLRFELTDDGPRGAGPSPSHSRPQSSQQKRETLNDTAVANKYPYFCRGYKIFFFCTVLVFCCLCPDSDNIIITVIRTLSLAPQTRAICTLQQGLVTDLQQ